MVGWMEIQAPISVLWVMRQLSKGGMRVLMVRILVVVLVLLDTWATLCLLCIAFWWLAIVSGVPPRRLLSSTAVQPFGVLWLPTTDTVRIDTPCNLGG